MKLGKRKSETKIVKETDTSYTFIDTTPLDSKQELEPDNSVKTISKSEKDLFRICQIDSRKLKIRHKSRKIGGQNRQSHSSVYE